MRSQSIGAGLVPVITGSSEKKAGQRWDAVKRQHR
jgi:hypothetical protein